jgi:hypothetical protein
MSRAKRVRLRIGKRIACGYEGCVYESGPYVVKVSDSETDFEFANEFKRHPAKHVVDVYRVLMIDNDGLSAVLVYMERLRPLLSSTKRQLRAIQWHDTIGSFYASDIVAAVKYVESKVGSGQVSEDTVRQVLELADELRQREMIYVDPHLGNAMMNDRGTIKLIDFGGFDWR